MISAYAYPGTFRKLPLPEPEPQKGEHLQPMQIAQLIAEYYQVPMDAIQGRSRVMKVVRARHMAWYFMGIYCPLISLKTAASLFGAFDHSTVIHARQTIKNLIETRNSAKFEAQHLDAIIKASAP